MTAGRRVAGLMAVAATGWMMVVASAPSRLPAMRLAVGRAEQFCGLLCPATPPPASAPPASIPPAPQTFTLPPVTSAPALPPAATPPPTANPVPASVAPSPSPSVSPIAVTTPTPSASPVSVGAGQDHPVPTLEPTSTGAGVDGGDLFMRLFLVLALLGAGSVASLFALR